MHLAADARVGYQPFIYVPVLQKYLTFQLPFRKEISSYFQYGFFWQLLAQEQHLMV